MEHRLAIHRLHAAGIIDGAATDDAAFAVYGPLPAWPAQLHHTEGQAPGHGIRPLEQALGSGPLSQAIGCFLRPPGPSAISSRVSPKSNIGHTSDTGTVQSVTAQEKNRSAAP